MGTLPDYIAKACDKHHVPRPRNGHWSKRRVGNVPAAPPPSAVEDEELRTVVIRPSGFAKAVESPDGDEPALAVPETLTDPHPLVKQTAVVLRKAKSGMDLRAFAFSRDGALEVHVSHEASDRALRILDTLIKAVRSRGWRIEVRHEPRDKGTFLIIEEELIPMKMVEAVRRQERPPTAQERKDHERFPSIYKAPWHEYVPTGQLALSFDLWLRDGLRRRWSDGKHQRIENLLPKILDALTRYSAMAKERRLEVEEENRKWAEEQRLREEKRERIRQEKADLDEVLQAADAWHKAERLRSYVAYVQRRARETHGDEVEDSFHKWVRWALNHADRLDPIARHQATVLDE